MKLRNRGMGLIGAVVTLGLLAMAAKMGMTIMMNQTKSSKAAKNSLDINGKAANVTSRLLREGVCSSMISGQMPNTPIPPSSNSYDLIGLEVGRQISGTTYTTTSLEYKLDGSEYFIEANFEKAATDKSFGPKTIQKKFPISVTVDASGALENCHSDVGNAIDTAVSQATNAVEQLVPLCVYQEESCGGYYPNETGDSLEVPSFDKSVTCTTRYKRHCFFGGTGSFHRTCNLEGVWNQKCDNGEQPSCYTKKETVCQNNIGFAFNEDSDNVRELRKCCRESETIEPYDSTGSSTSGSGSSSSSNPLIKWTCTAPTTPPGTISTAPGWYESVVACTPSETAGAAHCASGGFHGDIRCCETIPTGQCYPVASGGSTGGGSGGGGSSGMLEIID